MADAMQSHPVLIALGLWLLFAIVGVGMAALGGVIGVAIFEKRKGQPRPVNGLPPGYLPPGPNQADAQSSDRTPYSTDQPPSSS